MIDLEMTERERWIWDAAYAAAFVRVFEDTVEFLQDNATAKEREREPSAFDRAVNAITAERAAEVADLAVIRLREWLGSGTNQSGVGRTLDDFHVRNKMEALP